MKQKIIFGLCMILLISSVFGAITDGLVSYYPFDDDYDDDQGNNHATPTGSLIVSSNCIIDGCVNFDGAVDYLTINDSADLQFTGNMSISFWLNETTDHQSRTYLTKRDAGGTNYQIYAPGSEEFWFYDGSTEHDFNQVISSKWEHHVLTVDSDNASYYLDGNYIASVSSSLTADDADLIINGLWDGSQGWVGHIDELGIWNRSLTGAEVSSLYNGGSGYNPIAPPPPTLENNLILKNKNFASYNLNDITEGDEFYIMNNFTVSNVSTSNENCNFTANNISAHFSEDGDFNLDDSTDQLELIIDEGTTNLLHDTIKFLVCENSGNDVDLNIFINGSSYRNISGAIIPSCTMSNHSEINRTTEFIAETGVNITLMCLDCNGANRKLTILEDNNNDSLHFERRFSLHSEDMVYNASEEMYVYLDHLYEYVFSGTNAGNISLTCNTTSENFQFNIGEQNLSIDILTINNETYSPGMQIESNETTTIVIEVFGDIVEEIVFNVTYNNGTLIRTTDQEFINLSNTELNINQLYLISISALDDDGNLSLIGGNFQLNDTINPTIIWLRPGDDNLTEVEEGTPYQVSANVSDLNLFAYQLLVKDSFGTIQYNLTELNLDVSSKLANQVINPNITGEWEVNLTVSDDHTKTLLKELPYTIDNKFIDFEFKESNVTIEYSGGYDIKSIDLTKKEDRYSMDYEFHLLGDDKIPEIKLDYKIWCEDLYYRENSEYIAHFVCWKERIWVDFEIDNVNKYAVDSCGTDCYDISIWLPPQEKFSFNSLGGLNEIEEVVTFNVTAAAPTNTTLAVNECPSTIAGQMSLWLVVAIILFFVFLYFRFGEAFFGVITALGMFVLSWTLVGCSGFIGYIITALGVVLLLHSVFDRNALK